MSHWLWKPFHAISGFRIPVISWSKVNINASGFFFLFMHCLYVLNSNCAKFWLQNPACHHGHHHQICGKHVAKSVTLLKAHFVLILKMHINEKKKKNTWKMAYTLCAWSWQNILIMLSTHPKNRKYVFRGGWFGLLLFFASPTGSQDFKILFYFLSSLKHLLTALK